LLEFLAKKINNFLPQTKVVQKLFVGYLLLVLLPILVFGFFVYNQTQARFLEGYLQNRQELIEQASNHLKAELAQVESAYQLFQYNPYILEYLGGAYVTESQHVYSLIKDIRPLYSYVSVGNKQIKDIRMYSLDESVIPLEPEFGATNELMEKPLYKDVQDLPPGKGLWTLKPSSSQQFPQLVYYQKVYNAGFSEQIGIMEIHVTDDVIKMFMDKIKSKQEDRVYVVSASNELLFGDSDYTEEQNNLLQLSLDVKSAHFNSRNRDALVNKVALEPLNANVISYTSKKEVIVNIQNELKWPAVVGVICLMLLSAIYYWIASTLTKRILKLARHMRGVEIDNLSGYSDSNDDKDEINFLTTSYNAMLQRIDELVNKVHRAELLKKEADYKVLQAQIRPHFLYNTLESIRMMAEVKDAPEVAEFTHIFGKLIRYSLSNDKFETTLHDELEHVKNYLLIHKKRVGERLHYEINVQAQIKRIACPRFILQPIVENCIIHGLSRLRKQWLIKIRIYEEDNYLIIEINDNGVGIEPDRFTSIQAVLTGQLEPESLQTESGGFGLYNVHERVKSYYGHNSGLSLDNQYSNGLTCRFKLYLGGGKHNESISGG